MSGVLIKMKENRHVKRHTHTQDESHVMIGVVCHNTSDRKKLPERPVTDPSLVHSEGGPVDSSSILISSLQNGEMISFCCSKPPDMWYFIWRKLRQRDYIINLRSCTVVLNSRAEA